MVMAKCYKVKKPLEILEESDQDKIHETAMKVLNEVGIKMDHPEVLKLFKANGCEVDEAKKVVKIPESLIKEELKHVPKKFDIYTRGLERMEVGTDRFYMLSPSDNAYILDMNSQRRRPATVDDCRQMARLVDALEFYHICCTPVLPQELPAKLRGLTASVETLKNMNKHYLPEPVSAMEVKYLIEMGEAVAGGEDELSKKPVISCVVCPTSPLQFPDTSLAVIWGFAKKGLPSVISSGPLVGLGAPITMAGTLAIQTAENLSGITLAQLIKKGLPVLYGGSALPFDMSVGNLAHGAVEFSLFSLAEAQMGRYYGVPPYGAGNCTNSKLDDAQAGYEKMATTMLSYYSGINLAVEVSLDNHSLFAPEDLILHNEIAGIVLRTDRAFEVNEETLAFDLIKKVGIGGDYLAERHTRTNMRRDYWYPPLTDRASYETWVTKGAKDFKTRALERARKILADYKPEPLAPDVSRRLDEILEKVKKEADV
jgi:trimethylamine--corrinoid protein Co-methyltransferase